ncbi:MAG: Lrp/AsnC family transcriptional regulator [Myxococcota bacterium]
MPSPGIVELDEIDRQILEILQEDASLSSAQVAERVGLSSSPCWRRIQRLEKSGVIRKRVALLDPAALGLTIVVFASVRLTAHGRQALPEFEAEVARYPEVMECYTVSGGQDYLLRVATRDIHAYEVFLREQLLQLPSVAEVHSRIAITQVKYTTAMPVSRP